MSAEILAKLDELKDGQDALREEVSVLRKQVADDISALRGDVNDYMHGTSSSLDLVLSALGARPERQAG